MSKPTCYVRFNTAGQTVVWMRCPFCNHEIIIHPQPGPAADHKPWFELHCPGCARRTGEGDASADGSR